MVSWEGVSRFAVSVVQLQSFPIFCLYLSLVPISKLWQKWTKPVSLKWVLVVYNLSCSLISLYTLAGFGYGLYKADFIYQKEATPELLHFFHVYSLTKHLELLDTVFMVMRHRTRQMSVLHIYHHASMLLLSDYAYHFTPWPAIAVILALNAAVHVALYSYYGLTAFRPSQTPTWKRRLTEMQILQFYLDLVYAGRGYTNHGFCVYGFFYGLGMIILFSNFYYRAYIKVRPLKVKHVTVENDKTMYLNGKND